MWVVSPSPIYLIFIPSLIGGIAWAGFDLAAKTFIYDNVSKSKREFAISYYNLLIGIGVFFGASLSALLIKILQTSWISPIILIFLLGGILRTIVILFGIKRIQEVKKHEKLKGLTELTHTILKQAKPALQKEIHEIISIKDYIKER